MSCPADWQMYRTRFLVKARQLDAPLVFTDPLGREHRGIPGDYLVESGDGLQRIAPREIFEDIYVPMGAATQPHYPAHHPQKYEPVNEPQTYQPVHPSQTYEPSHHPKTFEPRAASAAAGASAHQPPLHPRRTSRSFIA